MPKLTHIQRSFSQGAISEKMLMRGDTEPYMAAALEMVNFMPTPQGSALRMPGTRFLLDVDPLTTRVIPYLTTGNEQILLLLRPGNLKVISGVMDAIASGNTIAGLPNGGGTVTFYKPVIPNGDFTQGLTDWNPDPADYQSGASGSPSGYPGNLGIQIIPENTVFMGTFADGNSGFQGALLDRPATLRSEGTVDTPADSVRVVFKARYTANVKGNDRRYRFVVTVSPNADFSAPIAEYVYTQDGFPPGAIFDVDEPVALPTAAWTGTLYVRVLAESLASSTADASQALFVVENVDVFASGQVTITEQEITTPWSLAELKDVQYVQSPYGAKELVLVHPRNAPRKFYFKEADGAFALETIAWFNIPPAWNVNNYPACVTSYHGRLILAGGQQFRTDVGDPLATDTETVWGTEVGKWDTFSAGDDVNPDDSIEFTAIYRSPIQWVYGQRTLLVGAQEYEYSASGDSIFSPGDLGVLLQSTHGSANVQPAGMGSGVFFPSDAGTKVREMLWEQDTESWVARDLTLLNPSICYPKIKRMARCRNPHQMCLVLTERGELSILHYESGVEGWSTYRLNKGVILDVIVSPDLNGVDVPFFLVERYINGVKKVYLECIPNFTESLDWSYMSSSMLFNFETPTNTITELDHLEGEVIQVRDATRFFGFFEVSGGSVTITDNAQEEVAVTTCEIGLQHRSRLVTLPIDMMDPGASKRFAEYSVRTIGSSRPVINGERPEERDPIIATGRSQPLDRLKDSSIRTRGWDEYQSVVIEEFLPVRTELLGVYGELQGNKV